MRPQFLTVHMGETEKRRVFRTATGQSRKVFPKTYAVDRDVADRVKTEAERRGVSQSCLMREIAEDGIVRMESVPAILRGGCKIEHLISVDPVEGKFILSSSGIYPTDGGPPFGWPHPCEAAVGEFVQKGIHEFSARCGGCVHLASSGMLPPPMREG